MSEHFDFPQGAVTVTFYRRCKERHSTDASMKFQYRRCTICRHYMADHISEGRCDTCRHAIAAEEARNDG